MLKVIYTWLFNRPKTRMGWRVGQIMLAFNTLIYVGALVMMFAFRGFSMDFGGWLLCASYAVLAVVNGQALVSNEMRPPSYARKGA